MAAPSYTYSLTNGATADASQVMQNYNDILNGVTDGTKDLTINALTANGLANLKGGVNLGDATADDISWNGSLATTLNIKTDNTYDIGTTSIGLRAAYFGANVNRTKIVGSPTMSGARTITLPDASVVVVGDSNTQTLTGVKTFDGQGTKIKGTVDASAQTAGYVGEIISQVISHSIDTSTSTSETYVKNDSDILTLTAGRWIIFVNSHLVITTNSAFGTGAAYGVLSLYDDTGAANVAQAAIMGYTGSTLNSANLTIQSVTFQATVNITGSKNYKVRIVSNIAGNVTTGATLKNLADASIITGTNTKVQNVMFGVRQA